MTEARDYVNLKINPTLKKIPTLKAGHFFSRTGVVQSVQPLLQHSDQDLVLEHTGCNVCYNTRIKLLEHTSVV
jgi:hypothetical protein